MEFKRIFSIFGLFIFASHLAMSGEDDLAALEALLYGDAVAFSEDKPLSEDTDDSFIVDSPDSGNKSDDLFEDDVLVEDSSTDLDLGDLDDSLSSDDELPDGVPDVVLGELEKTPLKRSKVGVRLNETNFNKIRECKIIRSRVSWMLEGQELKETSQVRSARISSSKRSGKTNKELNSEMIRKITKAALPKLVDEPMVVINTHRERVVAFFTKGSDVDLDDQELFIHWMRRQSDYSHLWDTLTGRVKFNKEKLNKSRSTYVSFSVNDVNDPYRKDTNHLFIQVWKQKNRPAQLEVKLNSLTGKRYPIGTEVSKFPRVHLDVETDLLVHDELLSDYMKRMLESSAVSEIALRYFRLRWALIPKTIEDLETQLQQSEFEAISSEIKSFYEQDLKVRKQKVKEFAATLSKSIRWYSSVKDEKTKKNIEILSSRITKLIRESLGYSTLKEIADEYIQMLHSCYVYDPEKPVLNSMFQQSAQNANAVFNDIWSRCDLNEQASILGTLKRRPRSCPEY